MTENKFTEKDVFDQELSDEELDMISGGESYPSTQRGFPGCRYGYAGPVIRPEAPAEPQKPEPAAMDVKSDDADLPKNLKIQTGIGYRG